ncbi:protein LSM14 homolog A isoform X3 [Hermetia illucens]|uniref:protein LSM14 homolog A isoform X3 n=1 Tax=Hermetia illucens TaxID=343691 RepID=UPI0018CBF55D|nr:protein LSM14 homolog A isoform X3 [Hermetia illucens]
MSGGMPELGSKISLISKADIRYEGRLFTVDPQECTIALANVRSFGTEDRETQYPIAPQSQIYDYILFRGSDIKDIRVVNNGMPHPNDPAIMQMQLPNGQPLIPHFPTIPSMGAPLGNYGNPFGTMGNLGGIGTTTGLAPGSFGLNKAKQPSELNDAIPEPSTISAPTAAEHKDQVSVIDLLAGASRSTTPVSVISRKSPSADMGVQVNQNVANRDQGGHNRRQNQQRSGNIGGGSGQRDRRDSGKAMDQQHNQHQDRNQNRNNQMHNNNQNRGWMNRGNNNNNNMRGNRGRGRMHSQGNFRQGANNNKGRPKNPLKFDQDYDFEQANNQFEELRSKLMKLKINGETDKKDDSGNETGAGDHEPEDDGVCVGYDKTKSFFDNISCEAATDRTKGKNRTDWRQERKLNSETFGISSTRRGNYRSRGGYYNRNMNMHGGGGGGYRGYRGGNNYRGRNNNRGGQQNNSGLPKNNKNNQNQQQQQQALPQNQQQQSGQQQQQPSTPQPQTPVVAAAAGN